MTLRAALSLALCLLLVGAGAFAVWDYSRMSKRVVALEATAAEHEDLKKSVALLQQEAARRASQDQAIRNARTRVERSVETAANETPVLRAYLDERIPDELRDAHRKARNP